MAVISLADVGISAAFCGSSVVNFLLSCICCLFFYQLLTSCGSV